MASKKLEKLLHQLNEELEGLKVFLKYSPDENVCWYSPRKIILSETFASASVK